MPELPEVETTVLGLRKKIRGREILDVWTDTPKLIKNIDFSSFKKEIKEKRIEKILRKGKNIIFRLGGNRAFLIHQKMTGHLLYGKWEREGGRWLPEREGPLSDPMNRFLHLIFFLDNNQMLALSDLRKFAKIVFNGQKEVESLPEIKKLGPDALEVNFEEFKKRIGKKRSIIKKVLMDQEVIAGIGNIYSDEILFDARINPFKKVKDLEREDIKKILISIRKILKKAIKLQGESFSDYRTPEGKKGGFDKERKVYRREGEKCIQCKGVITRKKIGSRSTYFCPVCQPL